jgi:hypothetical protein
VPIRRFEVPVCGTGGQVVRVEWLCSGNCCQLILFAMLNSAVSILVSLQELAFSSATRVRVLQGTTVGQLL